RRLTVAGGDVTIRNSSFAFDDWYHLYVTGGTVTVEHSEFDGLNTTTHADDIGVTGANVTVRSSRFVRLVNGLRLSSNSVAEGNVITQPNDAYGPAHGDGIEVYDGAHVVIRSNVIDITGGSGATGCVNIATDFGDIDDVLVEDNDLTGGTYSLYARLQGDGDAISNIRVVGNRWHTPHQYGTHSVDPTSSITEWSANTLDGHPVPF
ncbi:MAG TPA: right-handed parallel beta-helix repeat-containing protein, partial [Acidimicrobiales bacterium]|nr:right-handed parallel beta-helix repeat-containing protein [Acidimicrobiales bacterium]